jgi:tRNA A-37 threonylcarbamoyl transferase component Bud32
MKIELEVPGRREDVEAWLRSPGQGDVVKDNRVRSVHRWKGLFIKRFKPGGLTQRLRSAFNDKAFHEYGMLRSLRARGVPVPAPVAWARHDDGSTLLFTEEIPGARTLRDLPLTRERLRGLAALVRDLHRAGLRDDDLHAGNVLEAGGRLHLVDVHRAKLMDSLGERDRTESVAFLLVSIYSFAAKSECQRFIRGCGTDPARTWAAFHRIRDRYYRVRQARAWGSGSDFERAGALHVRRPFDPAEARRLLEAAPLRTVKELPGRRLWLVSPSHFVKEGARAAWENAFGLETRGIPTPRMLACCGDRVLGDWIEGALPLWDHLKAHGRDPDVLWRLARVVRRMHFRGVYHKDLKANNVLVRGREVWIVDLDRVGFSRAVGREDCIWNLAQLNAAVGAPVTRTDRLRFFFAYAGHDRDRRTGWKAWVRDVMKRTVERKHHWPERR